MSNKEEHTKYKKICGKQNTHQETSNEKKYWELLEWAKSLDENPKKASQNG